MKLCHVVSFVLLVGACTTDASSPADTRISPDSALDDTMVEDDTALVDTAIDAELPPPPEPVLSHLSIDWVLQSQSEGGSTLSPGTARTASGGVVIVAGFDHTVTFGGHTLVGSDRPYESAFYTRVTAEGDVAALVALPIDVVGLGPRLEPLDGERTVYETETRADLDIGVLSGDGGVERSRLVATGTSINPRALAVDAQGILVGGEMYALRPADGPPIEGVDDELHYPGRGFVMGFTHALTTTFTEVVRGEAGSTVGMVGRAGERVFAVGDFGGYPSGITAIFGNGDAQRELASVSSDDDPALDIFVAAWDLAAAPSTATLAWVHRIGHYSNGPRLPTWLRPLPDRGLELRVADAAHIDPRDGELHIGYPERTADLFVRFDGDGDFLGADVVPQGLVRAPGGFMCERHGWAGSEIALSEDGPTFAIPANDDTTHWGGTVLATYDPYRRLVAGGLLLAKDEYPPYPVALIHEDDGTILTVLFDATDVTLVPDDGPEVELARTTFGYERLIVARVRLTPR